MQTNFLNLESQISQLPKMTKPQIAALKKLEIFTVRDLLLFFPYRYLDFSVTKKIKELRPEENVSLQVKIKTISSRFSFRSHISMAEAVVSDESGSLKVVWFNQPYIAKILKPGDEIFLAGQAEYYNFALQMVSPIYEKVSDFPIHTARLVPVYHLTKNLYPKTLRNLIALVLPVAQQVIDILPKEILERQNLFSLQETIEFSHFPKSLEQVEKAKNRLAFEEIFYSQLAAQKYKLELLENKSRIIKFDQELIKNFLAKLPFKLTLEQKKAAWEIFQDLEKPTPMNRLIEGDVGSGKTLVAFMAALEAVSQGQQVAMLAPTEILAQQHFSTAEKYLIKSGHNFNTRCALFTRNFSKLNSKDIAKKKLTQQLKDGMPCFVIGTHALLEEKVFLKNLSLVIIDEQHRFGVEQRATLLRANVHATESDLDIKDLRKKAKKSAKSSRESEMYSHMIPHLLSLSATPIPRSLQLAFYGELDISRIKQKPQGRKQIITKLVAQENRSKAYEFIKNQMILGRQIFVVTPLIDESDKLGVKAASSEQKNLQKIFPQFKITLLHGRMKSTEKEQIMKDFLENKIQILVATSVVEVGVDVPNASVMVIEGAERFGLAQLHQFRGRVGRAEHQSYCFLFASPSASPTLNVGAGFKPAPTEEKSESEKRLEAFAKTTDGFELAELDLKLRGFGDLYGSSQSGWNFKYFDQTYISLIQPAKEEALHILKKDLTLSKYPELLNKIKDKIVHFE